MSVESLKSFFDIAAVVLLFLTFLAGAGVLITGNVINERQAKQLRQFDGDMTKAKTELGKQQERAANADARVAGLETDVANAETEMAKQQTRAAIAEKSLLQLQERVKPRRLTDKEALAFVESLRAVPAGTIDFGYTSGGGDEGFNFAKQLLALFKEAGWTVRNENSITNHLEIQVIGIGILTRGPASLDPSKPPPPSFVMLTPTLATLQSAFKVVGLESKFINWHPGEGDIPEVVVGSKPEPKP